MQHHVDCAVVEVLSSLLHFTLTTTLYEANPCHFI